MKLVVPALLLLRSIHAQPASARSEANATEPVAPNLNYPRSRLVPWWNNLTEDGAGSIASAAEPPQQIIDGDPTGGPVDYMVGLGDSAANYIDVYCGGTLIAPQFVLTAAHCMGVVDRVFVNLYDITNLADVEVIDFGPDDYVIYPGYDGSSYGNDVALIRLPHEVKNADIIQYPQLNKESDEPADGDSLLVLGWGATSVGPSYSDVLRQVEVDYVTNEQCSSDYDPIDYLIVTDDMMCARGDGKGFCYGDSGGPLILDNGNSDPVLVGVTSWSAGCAHPDYPGVYARVSYFADWINKQIKCARKGAFCPCSGSDNPEYLMVQAGGYNPAISLEVVNTCGDVPTIIIPDSTSFAFQAMCLPKGQYKFNIQDPSPGPGFPSGYIVQYGDNEVVLLGGSFSPRGVFNQGSFGTSATHLLASPSTQPSAKPSLPPSSTPSLLPSTQPSTSIQPTSKSNKSKTPKTKKRTKADKTTIRASFNKSGASYPSPGALIGVVLALNVLIVSIMSTVM